MRLVIERYSTRSSLGRHVFGDFPLPTRLLDDGERAVSVRTEGITRGWIEGAPVGSSANGRCCEYLSRVRIGDRHHAIAADREEFPVRRVDGKPRRPVART